MFMQHKPISEIFMNSIDPADLPHFKDSVKHLSIEVKGKIQKLVCKKS